MRYFHFSSVAALAAAMVTTTAYAQEVTSSIRGVVTSGGAPVVGATVTIVHVPSGTRSTSTTNADGSFAASGLRVGGPFTATVSAEGVPDYSVTGIQLTAGQPLRLPIELAEAEIVVTGTRSRGLEVSAGPITALDQRAIAGAATVNRDVRDLVRRDPFASMDLAQNRGVIIAGQNARSNRFSVDGLGFSDSYGLNTGGLPTKRGPVPIDAIEQLSVKVAPYDITEGNFQGGSVNVVLRSGTNDLTGSAFYTYTDDKLTGTRTRPGLSNATGRLDLDFDSKTYGGFISGPIIRDKLFLAFSYERLEEGQPVAIGTAGFSNVVPNLTDAQISNIASIVKSVYNYDTLGVQQTIQETDEKWTLKADWNITEGHRVSATWIHNKSNNSTASNASTVATTPSLGLQSNNTARPEKVDSYVAQINSDWSDNVHTELRGFYRKYGQTSVPFGDPDFAQMQVCLDPTAQTQQNGALNANATLCSQGSAAAPGAARLFFGPSSLPLYGFVKNTQYGTDGVLRWEYRDFSMKLNAGWRHSLIDNAFLQNATGTYFFDSVADLQARRAGSVILAGPISGLYEDALYGFKYDQYNFGGQVAWDPSATFNLTAGARIDLYGGTVPPVLNNFFVGRYGFSNKSVLNGKYAFQPRLSLTWEPLDRVRVRGGIGVFAGGSPDIFVGNSYSVTGILQNSVNILRNLNGVGCQGQVSAELCSAALDNVDGRNISPLFRSYLQTNLGALSTANVDALDPNYKVQSSWKTNLSVDYTPEFDNFLGSGWNLGTDLYYSWVNNAPYSYDLRLRLIGTSPDGRPRYASLTPTSANRDILITNTSKGHSLVAVARIDKSFRDLGLAIGGSYTFQDVTDVGAQNGTSGLATYSSSAMVDPNQAAYGTSNYEVRHGWKFHLDFDHAFFGDNRTRFSLFGERRSGLPYSLTMNDSVQTLAHGQVFGVTGVSNRFLLYVPNVSSMTADPLVTYDSAGTFNSFASFVTSTGLKQGEIVKKNSVRSPAFTKIDLHVDQEIPAPFVGGLKFKLFADVENVLNLINRDWGSLRQVAFPYFASIVNVACAATSGSNCTQYRYSNFSNPAVDNQSRLSLWGVRIGARVEF